MTLYQGGGVPKTCSIITQTQEFVVLVAINVLIPGSLPTNREDAHQLLMNFQGDYVAMDFSQFKGLAPMAIEKNQNRWGRFGATLQMFPPQKVWGIPVSQSVPCNKHVIIMGIAGMPEIPLISQFR